MARSPSGGPDGTRAVAAGRFKDKALELVRHVAETGEEIVITVRGEPKAKLIPAVRRTGNRFVGAGRLNVHVTGTPDALAAATTPRLPATPVEQRVDALHPGPRRLALGGASRSQSDASHTGQLADETYLLNGPSAVEGADAELIDTTMEDESTILNEGEGTTRGDR